VRFCSAGNIYTSVNMLHCSEYIILHWICHSAVNIIVQWICSLFQTTYGERGIVLGLFNLKFLCILTHGLLTWYELFSLLCILCSLLFCDIVILCVTGFLLCFVLFIVRVLYCVCLWCTWCYPNWGFSVLFPQL
jgi:hypothetical protein